MLIPLNLRDAKNIALSVIRTSEGYSVVPCNIVNGFGLGDIPSHWCNRKSVTVDGFIIDPITMFDSDHDMKVTGTDLFECIEKCLKMVEQKYNQ